MTTPDTAVAYPDQIAGLAGQPHTVTTAPVLTLGDVARAYPTWRYWPTVGGCMARAALVPSWIVHAATATGLLAEIEASIQRRREGGNQ